MIELWLNNHYCSSRGYETIQTMLSINHVPDKPISTYLAVITTFRPEQSKRQQITMEMTSNGHGWCVIVSSSTGYFMLRVTDSSHREGEFESRQIITFYKFLAVSVKDVHLSKFQ